MNPVTSENKGNNCYNKNPQKNREERDIKQGKNYKINKGIDYQKKIQGTGSVFFLESKVCHVKSRNKKGCNCNL